MTTVLRAKKVAAHTWQPISTAPKDGTKVDLWMQIGASPLSFGMSDAFRVIDAWFEDDSNAWWHHHKGDRAELVSYYITHWMPIPRPPK